MGRSAAHVVFSTFIYDLIIWSGTNAARRSSSPFVVICRRRRHHRRRRRRVGFFVARVLFFIAHSLFHSTMHDTMMILIRTHTFSPKNNAFLLLVLRECFVLAKRETANLYSRLCRCQFYNHNSMRLHFHHRVATRSGHLNASCDECRRKTNVKSIVAESVIGVARYPSLSLSAVSAHWIFWRVWKYFTRR